MSRTTNSALIVCALAVLVLLAAPPSGAWTPETRIAMADYALQVAPPHMVGQIERHKRSFHDGILAAAKSDPTVDENGEPIPIQIDLDRLLQTEADQAIRAIEDHRPFSQIVFQLGVVSYWVASVNNPLLRAEVAGPAPAYWQDYFIYLRDARRRFAVLYYGFDRQLDSPKAFQRLLARSQARSQTMAPRIAAEYQRIGAIDGLRLFDDRSTAFGVGALAFSHGVSDIAGVLRYIWIQAGGVDSRRFPPLDENHLILVDRGHQSP